MSGNVLGATAFFLGDAVFRRDFATFLGFAFLGLAFLRLAFLGLAAGVPVFIAAGSMATFVGRDDVAGTFVLLRCRKDDLMEVGTSRALSEEAVGVVVVRLSLASEPLSSSPERVFLAFLIDDSETDFCSPLAQDARLPFIADDV